MYSAVGQALDNQARATLIKMTEDIQDNMSLSPVLSYKKKSEDCKREA